MRQCILWGLQQRQVGMFTSVATMNGKQHAYLLWVEDSSGIEISVTMSFMISFERVWRFGFSPDSSHLHFLNI